LANCQTWVEAHLEPAKWRHLVQQTFESNEIGQNRIEIGSGLSYSSSCERWNRVLDRYTVSGKHLRFLAGAVLAIKGYTITEIEQRTGLESAEVTNLTRELGSLYVPTPEEQRREDSELADQLQRLRKKQVSVMMGTTPSGPLHLANVYTLATGAYRVDRACKKAGVEPHFTLGLNDLLVTEEQAQHVPEHRARIRRFLATLQDQKGIDIVLQNYSDVQREPGFRKQLREYRDHHVFRWDINVQKSPHEQHKFKDIEFPTTEEFNDPRMDYRTKELRPLIALRARYAKIDVYVLGGDHAHANGTFNNQIYLRGVPKPHLISTGVLYGLDGREMHVSDRNFISLEQLEKQQGWLDKILKLADAPTGHFGPFDYIDLLPKNGAKLYGVVIP